MPQPTSPAAPRAQPAPLPPSSRARFSAWLERFRVTKDQPDPQDQPRPDGGSWLDRFERPTKRTRTAGALLRAFASMLRGHGATITFALLTVVIGQGLAVLMPLLSQLAIDHVVLGKPWPDQGAAATLARPLLALLPAGQGAQLWALGAVSLVLAVVSAGIAIPGRYQLTRLVELVQGRLRRRLFHHMARLPLHRVQDLKSGGISSLLREDSRAVADLIFIGLYNPFKGAVTFLGGLLMMALIDWRLVLGGLALVPTVWLTHRTWIGRIRPIYSAIKRTRQSSDAHATEVFGGMRVVRTFGRARREAQRYATATHLQSRQTVLAWWWSRGIEAAWLVLVPLASAGVLIYGGFGVIRGDLTIGQLTAFTMYLLMLLGPMELIVGTASQLQSSLAGFDRCLDVLDEPTEFSTSTPTAAPARAPALPARADIRLEGVTFAYPGSQQPVLIDATLLLPAGKTVALVGPSGSGKTTLCNLVARFYDPTHGRVTCAGIDLRDIPVEQHRARLGIVEQDVYLFDGTIAENIAFARPGASHDLVRQAAHAANASEFIERFEQGYDTLIGERGVRLSGGQKQRIAIARAILADPAILILDEATSNLDTESERLIQRSLAQLMRGRTCVVIAHRLSTIRHADLIVVIEHGRIIETGTHDQLVARGDAGRYQRMLHAQIDPRQEEPAA
jgi:ATP-binding cassette subfamily B protein